MSIISFLKLIRYKNLLMVLLTLFLTKYALIDIFLPAPILTNFQFTILCLSILTITASGYIINDIFDIKTDKINKPKKAINNIISRKNTWRGYILLNIVGLISAVYLSIYKEKTCYTLFFFGTIIILFLYAKHLKKTPLTRIIHQKSKNLNVKCYI